MVTTFKAFRIHETGGKISAGFEALTLEAVKLAAELGVDVNAADINGRTALDAAKARKYDTVVKFLVDKGAVSGASKQGQTASAEKN